MISGIGPDLVTAKELASTMRLDNIIDFTGHVSYEDVPEVYRSADLFVSPTWSEGFSNTILEAMASGLPIVAARAIGVVDCLTDRENALFHEIHDVAGLSMQIGTLLDDALLRRQLATNAMREIQTKYRWPSIAFQLAGRLNHNLSVAPDNQWTESYPPTTSISDVDLGCRFRQAPHLL